MPSLRLSASWKFLCRTTAAVTLGLFLSTAAAQLPKLGPETVLHEPSTGNEHEVSVAMDAVGNYVVAYSHFDGTNSGIAVERFNRRGVSLGSRFIPHSVTAGVQQDAAVAMADDGRFVVVWEDNLSRGGNNFDVYFALYGSNGSLVAGPSRVNATATGVRENPRVAMNRATGQFVVVFAGGANQFDVDVFYRRFSAAGAALDAADIKVNSSTNLQTATPSVALAANGNFIVAWEGNPNGDANWEAYFQRYTFGTTAASAQGGNTVASEANHDTTHVHVACDEAGNFVLAWVDGLPASSNDPKDLLFRRYNSAGTALTGITVYKAGAFTGHGVVSVPRVRIAMENDEDFVITYLHNDEIYAKFFNANGTLKGSEIHVNTTSNTNAGEFQSKPWVAINPMGNRAAIVWEGTGAVDQNGAHIQRFAAPNVAPELTTITDKNVTELQTLSFTAVATEVADNFGDTITYSLGTGAPAGATINATTGVFNWTPTEAQGPGTYPVTIRATDDGERTALSDEETFNIVVAEANQNPTNLTLTGTTVVENSPAGTVVGTLSASDADLPAQTITFSLVAGAGDTDNALFAISGTSLQVATPPDFETKSSLSVRVRASDQYNGFIDAQFQITVEDVDEEAPTSLATIADPTIAGTNEVVVNFAASDTGDSGVATTELYVRKPGETSFSNSGLTPQGGNAGTFTYIAANDGIYEFFARAVDNNGNQEPEATSAQTSATVNLVENSDLTLEITAAAQALVFPMTMDLDTTITFTGAQVGAEVTVSRSVPATPPAYFQQPQYLLKESLSIEYNGSAGYMASLEWAYDPANLITPASITEVYKFEGGTQPAEILPAVVEGGVINVNGINSFSDWYAGTRPASTYNWELY